MTSLIIDHRDTHLDYDQHCLIIRQPDLPPRSVPLQGLERILCLHNVQLDTRILAQCQRRGVDFVLLNSRYSDLSVALHANHLQQAERRSRQYVLSLDESLALRGSRLLVAIKLHQGRRILLKQGDSPARQTALQALHSARSQLRAADDLNVLRGLEGSAQRALFAFWREQLPRELGFESRQRRPPRDPVNAVLSLSFTLLYHEAIRQCLLHGLDPWLGLYHRLTPGRQSLACDLMEPLRPWIEAWVVDSFVQGLFDRRHFSVSEQGCLFGKEGRSVFYPQWYARQPQWGAQMGRYASALARRLDRLPLTGAQALAA